MPRSARKAQTVAAATIEVSAKEVLAAHRQGAITLKKAERTAFRTMQIPLVLRVDQPMAQAIIAWRASKAENAAAIAPKKPVVKKSFAQATEEALDELDEEGFEPENDADLEAAVHAKAQRKMQEPAAPAKKAKAVKAPKAEAEAEAPKAKRAAKGEGKSRSPEARKARRIMREYLRCLLVATCETEDADVRETAQARADYLEQLIGEAV